MITSINYLGPMLELEGRDDEDQEPPIWRLQLMHFKVLML